MLLLAVILMIGLIIYSVWFTDCVPGSYCDLHNGEWPV